MKKQQELYRIIVSERYKNVTTGFIKKDLIDRFTSLEDSNYEASQGIFLSEYIVDAQYVGDILDELDLIEQGKPVNIPAFSNNISNSRDNGKILGIWKFNSFNYDDFKYLNDEEIESLFLKQYEAYRKGESPYKFPNGHKPKKTVEKNQVVNGLIDTIIHRMVNTYTLTEDLTARKLAVGTSNVVTNIGNAQLGLEKYRSDFTDAFQNSNIASFVLFVNRNTANGNESVVVADAGNTTTSIKISPGEAALFNIGDRIRVTTTSFDFTDITNIDLVNDILTLSSSEPLSAIPTGGEQVIQVWAEAGVFGNSNTGAAANTGTLYNRVNGLEFVKDDSKIILIEVQFIFTAL